MTSFWPILLGCRARVAHCVLLAAFAAAAADASALSIPTRSFRPEKSHGSSARKGDSPAYLALVGPTPLRFAPPPAPATERPTPPPPLTPSVPLTPEPADVETPATTPELAPEPQIVETDAPAPAEQKTMSILPDDTPRQLRAEDVLPYFELPRDASGVGASVVVPFTPASPSGATLPASSATYQQK